MDSGNNGCGRSQCVPRALGDGWEAGAVTMVLLGGGEVEVRLAVVVRVKW